MNTLLHPATAFIQSLPYTEVAYKDMGELQQKAVYDFMFYDGDGIWGSHVGSPEEALKLYGDVRFGVGAFPNDDAFKAALRAGFDYPATREELDLKDWFNHTFIGGCKQSKQRLAPIILNDARTAGEFGLVQNGFDEFNEYWAFQPDVEFVCFLPTWNPIDESGRGGQ